MIFPFGKHKGKNVADVPKGYLRWLLQNVELREPLLTAVRRAKAGLPIEDAISNIDVERILGEINGVEKYKPN